MSENPDLSKDQPAQEADEAEESDPHRNRVQFPIPRRTAATPDRFRSGPETLELSELVGIRGVSGIKLFVRKKPDQATTNRI